MGFGFDIVSSGIPLGIIAAVVGGFIAFWLLAVWSRDRTSRRKHGDNPPPDGEF